MVQVGSFDGRPDCILIKHAAPIRPAFKMYQNYLLTQEGPDAKLPKLCKIFKTCPI